jgi:hypothetical protein
MLMPEMAASNYFMIKAVYGYGSIFPIKNLTILGKQSDAE